jgi:hypothetical protein
MRAFGGAGAGKPAAPVEPRPAISTRPGRERDPHAAREAQRYEQPIASREMILQVLAASDGPMDADALAQKLALTAPDRFEAMEKRLNAMLRDGQLLQNRREAATAGTRFLNFRLLDTLPNSVRLENLAYRINIVGFVFWTFTLIAGAVWAERAWGRYWGWDTKEVWTFIIWVIYAGYIHARATKGWRGSRSAWLALIGFAAVLFNFGVVNIFFKGLHAYSGL